MQWSTYVATHPCSRAWADCQHGPHKKLHICMRVSAAVPWRGLSIASWSRSARGWKHCWSLCGYGMMGKEKIGREWGEDSKEKGEMEEEGSCPGKKHCSKDGDTVSTGAVSLRCWREVKRIPCFSSFTSKEALLAAAERTPHTQQPGIPDKADAVC